MWTCLYTFHAYRSWMADRKEGYVRHGDPVVKDSNEALANYQANQSRGDSVEWNESQQQLMFETVVELCEIYAARLDAFIGNPSHLHVLYSSKGARNPEQVGKTMKRRLTQELTHTHGKPSGAWFVKGHHRKYVKETDHFDQLIHYYLPDHQSRNTYVWINPVYGIEY